MVSPISTARSRQELFVWVTWLAKLLSGDTQCEWAAQFMANWQGYEQVPDGFDAAAWQIEHNGLLLRRKAELESAGGLVFTESQNYFRLKGHTGVLAGKADLVVLPDPDQYTTAVVEDAKTGKPQPSHVAQVLLYMLALPRAFPQYRNTRFAGRVVYKEHIVEVPADRLDDGFMEKFKTTWAKLASNQPAQKVPSLHECRFCKLTKADCADRMDEAEYQMEVTDLF